VGGDGDTGPDHRRGEGRRFVSDAPCPWVNEDGSTNVDGWLLAYAADDNTFWRTESGHIMNVVDALIERLDVPKHGRASTYNNWGCRCDACRAAGTEAKRKWRAKKSA
jgi:hypothetical protein